MSDCSSVIFLRRAFFPRQGGGELMENGGVWLVHVLEGGNTVVRLEGGGSPSCCGLDRSK